MKRECCKHGP